MSKERMLKISSKVQDKNMESLSYLIEELIEEKVPFKLAGFVYPNSFLENNIGLSSEELYEQLEENGNINEFNSGYIVDDFYIEFDIVNLSFDTFKLDKETNAITFSFNDEDLEANIKVHFYLHNILTLSFLNKDDGELFSENQDIYNNVMFFAMPTNEYFKKYKIGGIDEDKIEDVIEERSVITEEEFYINQFNLYNKINKTEKVVSKIEEPISKDLEEEYNKRKDNFKKLNKKLS
jgi:hypothetical protein